MAYEYKDVREGFNRGTAMADHEQDVEAAYGWLILLGIIAAVSILSYLTVSRLI